MNRITIKTMLYVGFAFLVGLIMMTSFLGLRGLDGARERLNDTINGPAEKVRIAGHLRSNLLELDRLQKNYILAQVSSQKQLFENSIGDVNTLLNERIVAFNRLASEEGKVMASLLETRLREYRDIAQEVRVIGSKTTDSGATQLEIQQSDREAYLLLEKEGTPSLDAAEKQLLDLVKLNDAEMDEAKVLAETRYETTRFNLLLTLGISVILGCIAAFLIIRRINLVSQMASRIGEGDLNQEFDPRVSDHDLYGVLRNMNTRLREIVAEIKEASNNVTSGSVELSNTGQQIAEGATEQAASLEEISSSMEEMSANISQTAENARQTETIAVKASSDAQSTGEAVQSSVAAMQDIVEKIGIISEIARQTNLLALNAAIEAARAGEHGKGFTVVAAEVRKLAERSQKAAGEIVERSRNSLEVSEKAGAMLAELVPSIQRTSELVQEISAGSVEQDKGATEVNKALQQLDQVVQQSASSAEEMAATSEELSAQAEQMNSSIDFFSLHDSDSNQSGALRRPIKQTNTPSRPANKFQPKQDRNAEQGISLNLDDDAEFVRY